MKIPLNKKRKLTRKKRRTYRRNRHKSCTETLCESFAEINESLIEPLSEPITKQNQEVVILSDNDIIISTTQINLLRKGLSFIPKPKQLDTIDLHNDIQKFMNTTRRKVRNHNKQFQSFQIKTVQSTPK